MLRTYSSPDRKKRPRNSENPTNFPSVENSATSKKRLVNPSAFSGANNEIELTSHSAPLDHSNSNSLESKSDPQPMELLTEMVKNENYSDFFRNSLTCSLSSKVARLRKEVSRLEEALHEQDSIHQNNEKKILALTKELDSKEEELLALKNQIKKSEASSLKGKNALIKALRDLEEKRRQERKTKLFNDSFRLGRVTVERNGTRFQEY